MQHLVPRKVHVLRTEELAERLEALLYPKSDAISSEQADVMLLEFCLNCPDPARAMDEVLEAPQGTKVQDVLDRALAMGHRSPRSYPESELAPNHPLRTWSVVPEAI